MLRAFCIAGARQEPGAVVELDDYAARETIALGKAELAGAETLASSAPMTTDSVPQIVQGKARRGAKDAEQ